MSAYFIDPEATGKSDLFRTIYEANRDRVHRLLARVAGPHDGEDLTQIVFAKAAAGLPQFRGEAQASTWLYRIAANVISDWLHSRAAREAKLALHAPAGPESAMTAALADPQPSPLAFASFASDDPVPALVELPVAAWNRFGALPHKLGQKIARKFGRADPVGK